MHLLGHAGRRLLSSIPLLLLFTALVFTLIHLTPGDPVTFFLPEDRNDPVARARITADLGLDQPLPVQYVKWLSGVARGDLGFSYNYGVPVTQLISERLGNSAELWTTTVIFALALSLPVGVISAVRRSSWFDHLATTSVLLGISLPDFWFGLMLLLAFSLSLGWLPASGTGSDMPPFEHALHFVLPTLVLGLQLIPFYVRFLRTSMLDALTAAYVSTARSKGLTSRVVLTRHALKNALLPMVTIVGFSIPRLVGSAIIVESIFAWPGIGRLALDAALRRDYPAVMGLTMVTFTFVVCTNIVVDCLYMVLDPRITFSRNPA